MISGRSAGASQPSQEANTGRNGMEIAPRTWAAAKRPTGRASMKTARSANRALERGWPVYDLATSHNPLPSEAERAALLDLLLKSV